MCVLGCVSLLGVDARGYVETRKRTETSQVASSTMRASGSLV